MNIIQVNGINPESFQRLFTLHFSIRWICPRPLNCETEFGSDKDVTPLASALEPTKTKTAEH